MATLFDDYPRPPEAEEPATRSKTPDRLALKATAYNDAQRSGIIEGALWACRVFRENVPGCGDIVDDIIEPALRKRFGDDHVDREKRAQEDGR